MAPPTEGDAPHRPLRRDRSMWAGVMIGVGVMAAVDEILFHQLLAWHHFYDRAGGAVGLVSDGVLHAAELFVLIAGFFLLASAIRRGPASPGPVLAGLFLGLGGFQLFDGLVNHKVLRFHQIRYGVELLPYDLIWNGAALVLLLAGAAQAVAIARTRRRGSGAGLPPDTPGA
ncbi:DUF2243 domain-containing protein [Arthrobacter sp. TMN-37]